MYTGKLIFSQIMDYLPRYEFRKCIQRYQGHYKVKNFSCMDQFLCMAFAQIAGRESLRDIAFCLRSVKSKMYHMGIRGHVSHSTLSDANTSRDWRIYADFAQVLINMARELYAEDDFGVDLKNTVYALDSTTIDLCLSVFPWAKFRRSKAAIKLHTLLDLRGPIPTFIEITDGKVHDVNILDLLLPEPGSYYIMDRAYLDFERLYALNRGGAFFITRAKSNTKSRRIYSRPVDKSTGIICDQSVVLTIAKSRKDYPEKLRRVRYFDAEINKRFAFLTNDFMLEPLVIAQLYKCRWQVELFFKWIKQHLRIKSFFGTSANAVKTQIWIAISVYVLVAIIKKQLKLQHSLYTILQILSVTVFEKVELYQLLTTFEIETDSSDSNNQLSLFDL